MSEAIICRRGASSTVTNTSVLAVNSLYTAPVSTKYTITAIGGGSGNNGSDGSVNIDTIYLDEGTEVPVTIGDGGNSDGGSGGTTSFGTYISANGGSSNSSISNDTLFGKAGGDGESGANGAIIIQYSEENL